MSDYRIPDPQDFDLERAKLQRRRKIAEELIRTQAPEIPAMGWTPSAGALGGVGAALGRLAGDLQSQRLDREEAELARREREVQDRFFSELSTPGRKRVQTYDSAQGPLPEPVEQEVPLSAEEESARRLKLYGQGMAVPGLRKMIETQIGQELDLPFQRAKEQAALEKQAELLRAQEEREFRRYQATMEGIDKRLEGQKELRSMPSMHISLGGNGRGAGGVKAPPGYRYNEDGTALEPIPGGPKDPNAQPAKPLTQKDRDLQRGFMNLDSALATYEGLLDKFDPQGKAALDPTARAALETAFTDVQMGMKSLYELGAPQAGDMRLLEQSFRNPTSIEGSVRGAAFGKDPFKAKVKQLRTLLNTSKSNFEAQTGKATPEAAKPPTQKTVVREVKLKDGRIGVEYSDGSRGYK